MCNAHFQHLFDDQNISSSSYPAVDVPHQQQQQQQQQNVRMHPHGPSTAGQDNPVPSLSPVSTSGWSYPMDAQSDVQMYSPASTTSYSSFHSPIDTNTRAYALAGALQQQQQQQQQHSSNAAYPESSQRSTELARGAPGHGHGQQAGSHFFPETQQPQRWGFTGPHAHEFQQEALSMSRTPIMDAQAQAPSASDNNTSSVSRDGHGRIQHQQQQVFASGNVPGGARLPMSAGPASAGTQRTQAAAAAAARHIHQGVPLNERAYAQMQQHNQHHRAMPSQNQHQQWLPQAQPQQMGAAPPFLQVPTPRPVNSHQPGALRNFFPYAAGGGSAELDYDLESDDFGEQDEYDEGLDDEDGSGHLHLGVVVPTNGSPTPELQFPQGVSGTPSDLMRTNFMLYGVDPANWPMESLGGGSAAGTSLVDANAGSSVGPTGSASPRGGGGKGKGVATMTPPEFFRPPEKREKGKRAQGSAGSDESEGQTVKVLVESATPGEPPKKVKMHQCRICQKLFPRPSGLATHMNSHSGARPFKCPLALCPKTFAVRSNARRHLRTHGITVPPNALNKNGQGRNQEEPFQVGFETPVIIDVQDPSAGGMVGDGAGGGAGARPPKLRWVPPSLATRTNAPRLRSLSPASDMADLDVRDASSMGVGAGSNGHGHGHGDYNSDGLMYSRRAPGLRIAPAPLPPALPSADEGAAADLQSRFDERNSYAEAGTYPYHPEQWRCLPGPGLVVALS